MSTSLLTISIIAKMNTSLRFINAIESIIKQNYSPIKIVVVDVNEENSVYSLGLQEDLSSYPQIDYVKLDHSLSMAQIRNYLLANLEGEYFAFLTANDTWDQEAALYHMELLRANPQAVVSCSGGILIDERKSNISIEPLIEENFQVFSNVTFYKYIKMPAQVVYQANALKLAGGFDEQFMTLCDLDMVLCLSKNNKVLISAKSLCECRIPSSLLDYDWKLFLDYKKYLFKNMDLFLVDKNISQEFYGRLMELAKINYMWLDFIVYIAMYFVKSPIRTIGITIKKSYHYIRNLYNFIGREMSIIKERVWIGIDIRRGNPIKKTRLLKEEDEYDLIYSSAKEFNELSSLDYFNNHKIRTIVIPEYVTTIKRGMFYGCDQLVSVEIPSTVTKIEAHAFHKCTNLRHVNFKENSRLSIIGDYAFAGCSSLEEINLPLISGIGAYTFAQCYSLKTISFAGSSFFPNTMERIPPFAFAGCRSLVSVEFAANSMLEYVDDGAFFGCKSLENIVITGRLKKVGAYAFAYCKKLESVAIIQIDSVESIGKGAFMYCESLPYFQLPNGLERIFARTFYGCSRLKFIKIPKKVLSINHQAFSKCHYLENVLILSGDVVISPNAFDEHTRIEMQENVNTEQFYRM